MKNLSLFRGFIERQSWIDAKTYKTAPHRYIVKTKLSEKDKKIFELFALFIRKYGYEAKFWSKSFIYYEIDGYKYWTYGDPIEDTIILNRVRL